MSQQTRKPQFLRFGAIAAAGLGLVAAGTLAVAATSADTAVQTRQANFKEMGKAMKTLKDELGSGSPSKTAMAAAAKTLVDKGAVQPDLFPNGSGESSAVKNDALMAIWTKRADFNAGWAEYKAEAAKLASAVNGGDTSAIQAQFKATGATCGSCHRQFRAD